MKTTDKLPAEVQVNRAIAQFTGSSDTSLHYRWFLIRNHKVRINPLLGSDKWSVTDYNYLQEVVCEEHDVLVAAMAVIAATEGDLPL